MTRYLFRGLLAATALGLAPVGCSDARPQLLDVAGTVTLDGKPLPDGAVSFVDRGTGVVAGGGPVANGAFGFPVAAGGYKVAVVASRAVPGRTAPGMGDDPVLVPLLPARYNTATTLTADVAPGRTTVALALTSDPPHPTGRR